MKSEIMDYTLKSKSKNHLKISTFRSPPRTPSRRLPSSPDSRRSRTLSFARSVKKLPRSILNAPPLHPTPSQTAPSPLSANLKQADEGRRSPPQIPLKTAPDLSDSASRSASSTLFNQTIFKVKIKIAAT